MAGDEYHKGNYRKQEEVDETLAKFRVTLGKFSQDPVGLIQNHRAMIQGLEQRLETVDEEVENKSRDRASTEENTEAYRLLLVNRDTLFATLKAVEAEKVEDYINPNLQKNRAIRWASAGTLAGLALGAGMAIGIYNLSINPSSKYAEPNPVVTAMGKELAAEKKVNKDISDKLARNQKLYNPNVRYNVAYSLGKNPTDFVLKVKNQKTDSEVDLTNMENWDNMLRAGGYHNFMNASRISGLDKYFTKDAIEALEDYRGSVLIHAGNLRFFVDGKEVASSEVEPAVLKKTWEIYASRKNK